jgi:hypothetical protein
METLSFPVRPHRPRPAQVQGLSARHVAKTKSQIRNLGVSSWTTFDVDEDGPYLTEEQIGYDKLNGKWSILLRSVFEDRSAPSDQPEDVSTWFFTEAPRHMRLKGIGQLHKLLAQLNEDAQKAAKDIITKSVEAELFAKAIYKLADDEAEKTMTPPPTEAK